MLTYTFGIVGDIRIYLKSGLRWCMYKKGFFEFEIVQRKDQIF